ncbi:hypothetical protein, partial [Geomicrobium sp. JCM 19037]|uniref:hypothetical protein n=1 Tax=Geomicrobium sp. JCM 19037 TaxID=1460634 RepID=UPI0005A6AF27
KHGGRLLVADVALCSGVHRKHGGRLLAADVALVVWTANLRLQRKSTQENINLNLHTQQPK